VIVEGIWDSPLKNCGPCYKSVTLKQQERKKKEEIQGPGRGVKKTFPSLCFGGKRVWGLFKGKILT